MSEGSDSFICDPYDWTCQNIRKNALTFPRCVRRRRIVLIIVLLLAIVMIVLAVLINVWVWMGVGILLLIVIILLLAEPFGWFCRD